jgi:hypothetical protein
MTPNADLYSLMQTTSSTWLTSALMAGLGFDFKQQVVVVDHTSWPTIFILSVEHYPVILAKSSWTLDR